MTFTFFRGELTIMDQSTHNVRRANWLNIITACQQRPVNVSVRQWLADNGVKEKAYYYWLRKFRREACEQIQKSNFHGRKKICNNRSFAGVFPPSEALLTIQAFAPPHHLKLPYTAYFRHPLSSSNRMLKNL